MMRLKIFYIQLAFITTGLIAAGQLVWAEKAPTAPHLLPVGGRETLPPQFNLQTTGQSSEFQPILTLGQRAIEWLNLVNQNRDLTHRLNLADRTTKNPVPPETPKVSSAKLLIEKYNERLATMPELLKPYLLEQKELVEIPPLSDEDFLKAIRDINKVYQATVRWLGQTSYLEYYSRQDVRDIRGYYFFMKDPTAVTELNQFEILDATKKAKYSEWLISMCHNSMKNKSDCAAELSANVTPTHATEFYNRYLSIAKSTYDAYFTVKKIRSDLTWNPEGTAITQDFITPTVQKISDWLKTNVEEEWKALGFQLLIQFIPENSFSPYVEFEKGVTPHVSGFTWNVITMDPDYSLDDYDTQWTIRHEFGHVLGFPDCYLEFYEKEKEQMVYYTIEPDNLMCAWGGVLQPSHIQELKRVYQ